MSSYFFSSQLLFYFWELKGVTRLSSIQNQGSIRLSTMLLSATGVIMPHHIVPPAKLTHPRRDTQESGYTRNPRLCRLQALLCVGILHTAVFGFWLQNQLYAQISSPKSALVHEVFSKYDEVEKSTSAASSIPL